MCTFPSTFASWVLSGCHSLATSGKTFKVNILYVLAIPAGRCAKTLKAPLTLRFRGSDNLMRKKRQCKARKLAGS